MEMVHRTVLARFRRAFPEGEGVGRWNEARGAHTGGEDYWGPSTSFRYAGRGTTIYFPHTVDHAHLPTHYPMRCFGQRAEALQQCLSDNGVPIGPAWCNSPVGEYVIGPEHPDAIIEVLRR